MLNLKPQKHTPKLDAQAVYSHVLDGLRVGQDVSPIKSKSGVWRSHHLHAYSSGPE